MFPLLLREEQESIKIRTVANLKAGIFTDAHWVIYKNRSSTYKFELIEVFFPTVFVWTNCKERFKFITVVFCTSPLISVLRGMYIMISSSQVLFISPIKAATIYQAMHDGECGKTVSVLITRQFESMSPGDRSHSNRSHVTSQFNSVYLY